MRHNLLSALASLDLEMQQQLAQDECLAITIDMFRKLEHVPSIDMGTVCVCRSSRVYHPAIRYEGLEFIIDKQSARHLSLLVLWSVLKDSSADIVVNLTHAVTVIKRLVIRSVPVVASSSKAEFAVRSFEFVPREFGKHPWVQDQLPPEALPYFLLSNAEDSVVDVDSEILDHLIITGSLDGMLNLAEFLLSIGMPQFTRNEYDLESECGFRGVGPGSCEVRLSLPGSLAWQFPPP